MKDAYELLYQKEADLVRVRQEIESLKITAELLGDDQTSEDPAPVSDALDKKPAEAAMSPSPDSEATGTDGPFTVARRAGFWNGFFTGRR